MSDTKTAAELIEISTVDVDPCLPKQERMLEYIRQIKDPYHYKCGKFKITAIFPDTGPSIEDCLQGIMA